MNKVPDPIQTIQVIVAHEVAFDMEKMRKVTGNLLARLGCPKCHSGFDIRFIQERGFVVNSRTLDVQGFPELG